MKRWGLVFSHNYKRYKYIELVGNSLPRLTQLVLLAFPDAVVHYAQCIKNCDCNYLALWNVNYVEMTYVKRCPNCHKIRRPYNDFLLTYEI